MIWCSENGTDETYLQVGNREADIEVDTGVEEGEGGTN